MPAKRQNKSFVRWIRMTAVVVDALRIGKTQRLQEKLNFIHNGPLSLSQVVGKMELVLAYLNTFHPSLVTLLISNIHECILKVNKEYARYFL